MTICQDCKNKNATTVVITDGLERRYCDACCKIFAATAPPLDLEH